MNRLIIAMLLSLCTIGCSRVEAEKSLTNNTIPTVKIIAWHKMHIVRMKIIFEEPRSESWSTNNTGNVPLLSDSVIAIHVDQLQKELHKHIEFCNK